MRSTNTTGRLVLPLAMVASAACSGEHYKMSVVRSLQPVDAARSMVVFTQIRGEACGRDAVLGAIRDMKRLRAVDGFVEVVIETRGAGMDRCATATGYPFRYGTSTDSPPLDPEAHSESARVIPGRDAPPPPLTAAERCGRGCASLATSVEPEAIKQALVRERCIDRCVTEPAFAECLASQPDPAGCLPPGERP